MSEQKYMKLFEEFINEGKGDKVYFEKPLGDWYSLWIAHSPNSGTSIYLDPKEIFKTFFHDFENRKDDGKYSPDSVRELKKALSSEKPTKTKGDAKIYKIPVYEKNDAKDYDIWGGDQTPEKYVYIRIVENEKGNSTIMIFPKLKEAVSI